LLAMAHHHVTASNGQSSPVGKAASCWSRASRTESAACEDITGQPVTSTDKGRPLPFEASPQSAALRGYPRSHLSLSQPLRESRSPQSHSLRPLSEPSRTEAPHSETDVPSRPEVHLSAMVPPQCPVGCYPGQCRWPCPALVRLLPPRSPRMQKRPPCLRPHQVEIASPCPCTDCPV